MNYRMLTYHLSFCECCEDRVYYENVDPALQQEIDDFKEINEDLLKAFPGHDPVEEADDELPSDFEEEVTENEMPDSDSEIEEK